MNGRVVTCAYCGQEYPEETAEGGGVVLTEHIAECPMRPLLKAEADVALLREALVGLIGARDTAELKQMELSVRLMTAPGADKIACLNAIDALLATMPEQKEVGRG